MEKRELFCCVTELFSTTCGYFLENSGMQRRTAGCGYKMSLFYQLSSIPISETPKSPSSDTRDLTLSPPLYTDKDHLCTFCPLDHLPQQWPARLPPFLLSELDMLPGQNLRLFLLLPKFLSIPCEIWTITELCC